MCRTEEKIANGEFNEVKLDVTSLETIINNAENAIEDNQNILDNQDGRTAASRQKIANANKRLAFYNKVLENAQQLMELIEKGEFVEEFTSEDY